MTPFYYLIRPFIPRRCQLFFRRRLVSRKRNRYSAVWPIDPAAAAPPQGWPGWPEGKKFALVLQHDVDSQKGHDQCRRLAELEQSMGFRSSFNFVPERYTVSSRCANIFWQTASRSECTA